MKLSTLMVVFAVVDLVYALGLLLVPATLLSLYGVSVSPGTQLMAQFFGVELGGIGLLAWFARKVTDSDALRAIILAFFISEVIGVIVSLFGTLSNLMNVLGWSAVGLYAVFGLGLAYFLFMKPSAS